MSQPAAPEPEIHDRGLAAFQPALPGLRRWDRGGGNLAGQDTGREALSHTRLSAFVNCHQRYAFAYEHRLAPIVRPTPLALGAAFQKAVELRDPRAGARTLERLTFNQEDADRLLVQMTTVEAAAELYLRRWPGVDAERREFEYRVRLRNPVNGYLSRTFDLHGFADGLIDRGDHWLLIENKLVGQITENAVRRLALDRQLALACYGVWRATGKAVREVTYRWVRKPSIRQRKDETAGEFCDRMSVDFVERADWYGHEEQLVRQDSDLSRIEAELWQWAEELRHGRRGGVWTRNTGYCLELGGCPFLPLCLGDPDALALFSVRPPHETGSVGTRRDAPLSLAPTENPVQLTLQQVA